MDRPKVIDRLITNNMDTTTETYQYEEFRDPDIFLCVDAIPISGYKLIKLLGKGGFGEVWEAEDLNGFHVAIKFVLLEKPAGEVERRALKIIERVKAHPRIIEIVSASEHGQYLVIIMEKADQTLFDKFEEYTSQNLPGISAPEIYGYFLDAAEGIDHLNEIGIQHRDIKPKNLLLAYNRVKVADYGLVKFLRNPITGHSGDMTVAYAAPEFFSNQTSTKSDLYSLAITYCQLRGGRLPFRGTLTSIMSGHVNSEPDLSMIPENERPIVAIALAKEPMDRTWQSCREFINALKQSNESEIEEVSEDLEMASVLVQKLRNVRGGPWLMGVAMGLHRHSPVLKNNDARRPIPLTELAVADKQVEEVLVRLTGLGKLLNSGRGGRASLSSMEQALREIAKELTLKWKTERERTIIQAYDAVNISILSSVNVDIIERNKSQLRLDEAESLLKEKNETLAITLIEGITLESPRKRQLHIEALTNLKRYSEIVEIAEKSMMRFDNQIELQRIILSYLKTGNKNKANEIANTHYDALNNMTGKLFLIGVERSFPSSLKFKGRN